MTDTARSFDRHREKQISRERDDHALRSGAVSIETLSRQNNFFASLDLSRARIGWPHRRARSAENETREIITEENIPATY